MRSGPFTSLSPPADRLPARIAGYFHSRTSIHNDETLPLVEIDPETSQLLPRRERPRRVRIQGRLVMVRTVSVANIGQAKSCTSTVRTDISRENSELEDEDRDDDDEDADVVEGDLQFRGYGIGGAGNIRTSADRRYGHIIKFIDVIIGLSSNVSFAGHLPESHEIQQVAIAYG
ncbi:hypothetical protein F5Y01DRAFT_316947 [Xylaria sp. FL0043]|nr:hypothetical protein F5Y01DRAFT_316947 [Xylaria sp. FL0043]